MAKHPNGRRITRLIVAALFAGVLSIPAAPALAAHVGDRAQDGHACTAQQQSPSCRSGGFERPGDGWVDNHNETLVAEA